MSVASNFSDRMEFAISDKRFYQYELRFDQSGLWYRCGQKPKPKIIVYVFLDDLEQF